MSKQWIKIDVQSYLAGDLAGDLTPVERDIFNKLNCMASVTDESESDKKNPERLDRLGYIELSKGHPKNLAYITMTLNMDIEIVKVTIDKLIALGRMLIVEDTYFMVNYAEEQKNTSSHSRLTTKQLEARQLVNGIDFCTKNPEKAIQIPEVKAVMAKLVNP